MTDRDRDYLWDGAGPVDPEVARLEGAMAPLRHREPLRLPLPARKPPPRRWPIYAGGAALAAAAALLLVWWTHAPSRPRPRWRAPRPCPADRSASRPPPARRAAAAPRPTGGLPVGTWLETGDDDAARLEVADIGDVALGADSRLAVVGTSPTEHRLSLARGNLHARVTAPPRLFVIETPTATAIDLGCEYDLEVAADGAATLRVTSGVVELTDGARLVVVPMGACAVDPARPRAGHAVGADRAAGAARRGRALRPRRPHRAGGGPAPGQRARHRDPVEPAARRRPIAA